jgi:hypothetical protein
MKRHDQTQTPIEAVAAGVSHAKSKRDERAPLESIPSAQAEGRGRVVVRFTRVTLRPLDPDNHGGSVKAVLDCLRAAFPDLIRDDSPEDIDLELRQVRCSTKDEQGTFVEVWEREEE